MNKAREFDQSVLTELQALLGERVTVSAGIREHHGKDESYLPYAPPDAVAFPESTEEVRDIVNICRRHRVPMIPYGVGTSLEGHILAIRGGVCLDMSQMNKVLAVHQEDLDAVVAAIGAAGLSGPAWRVVLTRPKRSSTPVIPLHWLAARRLSYGDTLVFIFREV